MTLPPGTRLGPDEILAPLNHPNIAAIYGLEESGRARHLVLDLVPGETLAARLARGSLPMPEALAERDPMVVRARELPQWEDVREDARFEEVARGVWG